MSRALASAIASAAGSGAGARALARAPILSPRLVLEPHHALTQASVASTCATGVRCMGTLLSKARAITAVDASAGGRHRVATIDTRYPGPMSAFLVVDAGRASFVDVNTRFAVPWYA